MKQNKIPGTDLMVSELCLGTMTFGTPVGESEAISLTQQAIDLGINFIDTANMYEGYARHAGSAGGVAEEILGKALKGRREGIVLATKVGMKVGEATEDEGTSPAAIRKQLNLSLERLTTDYIDIYYLHRPDSDVPLADILGELKNQIDKGKIRYYGISNYSAEQTAELLEVADLNHLPRPIIHQPGYSLLKTDVQKDLLLLCEKEKIAVAPYQVLQGGLLTGKYRRGFNLPTGSRKTEMASWLPDLDDELFDKLEVIEAQAEAKGRTMIKHALLEVLEKPPVISIVAGVKRIDQLESLIAAIEK